MKMYLNSDQTAKLIEFGVEKPKSISGYYHRGPYEYDAETNTKMVVYDDTQYPIHAYSIGELLSFLPKRIDGFDCIINLSKRSVSYNEDARVDLRYGEFFLISCHNELIDALYEAIVELKRLELNKKAKWVNRHDTKDKKD